MFGRRYYGGRYYAPRYFGDGGSTAPVFQLSPRVFDVNSEDRSFAVEPEDRTITVYVDGGG